MAIALREKILQHLKENGPRTDAELAAFFGVPRPSVRRSRLSLGDKVESKGRVRYQEHSWGLVEEKKALENSNAAG